MHIIQNHTKKVKTRLEVLFIAIVAIATVVALLGYIFIFERPSTFAACDYPDLQTASGNIPCWMVGAKNIPTLPSCPIGQKVAAVFGPDKFELNGKKIDEKIINIPNKSKGTLVGYTGIGEYWMNGCNIGPNNDSSLSGCDNLLETEETVNIKANGLNVATTNDPDTDRNIPFSYPVNLQQGSNTITLSHAANDTSNINSVYYTAQLCVDDPLSQGLIGYWKMDENAGKTFNDASGNNLFGTFNTIPQWGAGMKGSAAQVQGNQIFASVQDTADNGILDFKEGDPITMSLWVKRNSVNSDYGPVMVKGSDTSTSEPINYSFMMAGNKVKIYFTNPNDSTNMTFVSYYTNDEVIKDTNWHHILVKHIFGQASSTKLFVDCKLAPGAWTGNGSLIPKQSNGALSFGRNAHGDIFNGWLDDIRLYKSYVDDKVIIDDLCVNPSGNSSSSVSTNPQNYTVQVVKNGQGIVTGTNNNLTIIDCGVNCTASVASGNTVTLKATPSQGYVFVNWSGITGCTSQPICTFVVKQNTKVTANFSNNAAQLDVIISGAGADAKVMSESGGISCPGICTEQVVIGDIVKLTAASTTSIFNTWIGTTCQEGNTSKICTFVMNTKTIVTAQFTSCGNAVCDVGETSLNCSSDCNKIILNPYTRNIMDNDGYGSCKNGIGAIPSSVDIQLKYGPSLAQQCNKVSNVEFYCSKDVALTPVDISQQKYIITYSNLSGVNQNLACPISSSIPSIIPRNVFNPQVTLYQNISNTMKVSDTSLYGSFLPKNYCTGIEKQFDGQQGVASTILDPSLPVSNFELGKVYTLNTFYDYVRAFKQFTRASVPDNNSNIIIQGVTPYLTLNSASKLKNTLAYVDGDVLINSSIGSNANPFILVANGTVTITSSVTDIYGVIVASNIILNGHNADPLNIYGNISAKNGILKTRTIDGVCNYAAKIQVTSNIFSGSLLQRLSIRSYSDQKLY